MCNQLTMIWEPCHIALGLDKMRVSQFFFADFEIPYLQKDKITRIEIWVMHEIGGPKV